MSLKAAKKKAIEKASQAEKEPQIKINENVFGLPLEFADLTSEQIKTLPIEARRKIFCKVYVATNSPQKAAIAAGYSQKTASSAGGRLLANVNIQGGVQQERKLQAKIIDKLLSDYDDSFEAICREFKRLAFGIESTSTRREGPITFVADYIKMDALKNLARLRGYDAKSESRTDPGDEKTKYRESIGRVLQLVRKRKEG